MAFLSRGHGDTLPIHGEAAIDALVENGGNVTDAAKRVGISTQTLKNWLKLPEFRAAYLCAQVEARNSRMASLLFAVPKAVAFLVEVLENKSGKHRTRERLYAARVIIEQTRGVDPETGPLNVPSEEIPQTQADVFAQYCESVGVARAKLPEPTVDRSAETLPHVEFGD